jgi:ubiquinone/menaquinone biosynthesis C-methylase UbiE
VRLQNALRDFSLYADEHGARGRRLRLQEVCRNLAIGFGATSLRGEPIQFVYQGYKIPLDLAEMTGGADESWEDIALAHLDCYERWAPIRPDDAVLEIGCGIGRDAIHLAGLLSSKGRYVGIDITRASIEWCRRHITRRHPNFEFVSLDVRSAMYNPAGAHTNADVEFPLSSESFDRVVLHSVFTHMFVDDIAHYLSEISRVMRPDAALLASFFVFDEATLDSAQRHDGALTFRYEVDRTCRINDPDHPEAAVAYTLDAIDEVAADSGLQVLSLHRGFWSGANPGATNGQDVAILGKHLGAG